MCRSLKTMSTASCAMAPSPVAGYDVRSKGACDALQLIFEDARVKLPRRVGSGRSSCSKDSATEAYDHAFSKHQWTGGYRRLSESRRLLPIITKDTPCSSRPARCDERCPSTLDPGQCEVGSPRRRVLPVALASARCRRDAIASPSASKRSERRARADIFVAANIRKLHLAEF